MSILANVQDGSAARAARETPARASACSPSSGASSTVKPNQRRGAGADLWRSAGDVSGQKVVITCRVGQAAEVRPSSGRGEPDWGVRVIRIAEGIPGLVERQLEAIASAAARTGNPPWVLAPMIATAEGSQSLCRPCPFLRPDARGDDRGAGRGAAGRPDPGTCRVPVHWNQRPRRRRGGRTVSTRRQRARNELEPVGTNRGVSERITGGAPVLINAHRGVRPQAQRPSNAAPPRYALCRIVWPQSARG